MTKPGRVEIWELPVLWCFKEGGEDTTAHARLSMYVHLEHVVPSKCALLGGDISRSSAIRTCSTTATSSSFKEAESSWHKS